MTFFNKFTLKNKSLQSKDFKRKVSEAGFSYEAKLRGGAIRV